MEVNSYIVCTYATYDVFIYINKQSVLTRLDRSRIQWSLSLYIKHRLNMNRLKTRSFVPAPCSVKRDFYRIAIFVTDEIFLKYYNSRKTPSWKWGWRHLAAAATTIPPCATRGKSELLPWLRVFKFITSFFQKSSGRTNATLKKSINEEKLTNKPKILTSSL